MKQPGFMIYAEDWAAYTEDYNDEELGRMLRALLGYFDAQEQPTFDDRGMRQFFKLAAKGIDLDRKRYEDKCRQNAYNRYKGTCRMQHEKPLSFEAWLAAAEAQQQTAQEADDGQRSSTTVNDGHQSSPIPTPTINNQQSTVNSQQSTVSNQKQEIKNKKSVSSPNAGRAPGFADGPYRPLSEDDFEKQREEAIAHLRAVGERHYSAHTPSVFTEASRRFSSP